MVLNYDNNKTYLQAYIQSITNVIVLSQYKQNESKQYIICAFSVLLEKVETNKILN
jgi:hypothetical protein